MFARVLAELQFQDRRPLDLPHFVVPGDADLTRAHLQLAPLVPVARMLAGVDLLAVQPDEGGGDAQNHRDGQTATGHHPHPAALREPQRNEG